MDNSEAAMDKPDSKNSFLPAMSHFILILIEHSILVGFIIHGNFVDNYGLDHTVTFCWLPFVLWLFAAATMAVYYIFFNKARLLRELGPQFNFCKDETDGVSSRLITGISCTGLVCCNVVDGIEISVCCPKCYGEGCSSYRTVKPGSKQCCCCHPLWPWCKTGSKPTQEPEAAESEPLDARKLESLEMKPVITNGKLRTSVANGNINDNGVSIGIDTVDEVRTTPKSSNRGQGSKPSDPSDCASLLNGHHSEVETESASEDEINLRPSKEVNEVNIRAFKPNGI